jgi:RNA polymerase sigma factor (TIGR02999 family)
MDRSAEATQILSALCAGDSSRVDRLMEIVYDELHAVADGFLKRENPNHTLQPTALVHEAYLKLLRQREVDWQSRSHFLAVGAQAMRRILVDHARAKKRDKRGGKWNRVELKDRLKISTKRSEDVLALDRALTKLAELHPQQAQIVEMRFFGGMTIAEIAAALGMSKRTAERHWTMVRAWLRRELDEVSDT